ncbi:hypothetical protein IscW_ISCW020992 [Ixodes scapularis]|uniref:Uncharacterized protein n=1 Tax=Ixodes scapularis TaxID=6945 RepID=B7Q5T3_IXOSC|nr:hypothetical protein IscW_ISCW020992 [Ixodes scapularis]|eukprot:XP_002402232.1 hypothetical protein IscW_ISCW020992 [Ixodes scapularis]
MSTLAESGLLPRNGAGEGASSSARVMCAVVQGQGPGPRGPAREFSISACGRARPREARAARIR